MVERDRSPADPTCGCVPGLYKDTLAAADTGTIALLHADADWYESTMNILDNLWSRMVPGGIVVFDDYNFWSGCKQAVTEFLERIGVTVEFHEVSCAAWFRVPARQAVEA